VIFPVVAPKGTVATNRLADETVYDAGVPLNFTEVAPVRFPPSMKTEVPAGPLPGKKSEREGVVTVKLAELYAAPAVVLTLIGPLVQFDGTTTLICVLETRVNEAGRSFKYTLLVPVKFVPVTTTVEPAGPLAGLKPVIETDVTLK